MSGTIHQSERVSEQSRFYTELPSQLQMFEKTGTALAVTDAADRAVLVNEGFTRTFGYEPGEVLGKSLSLLLSESESAKCDRYMRNICRREALVMEDLVRGRSGVKKWVSIMVNPVFSPDGKFLYSVCAFTDITETRMREILLRTAMNGIARNDDPEDTLTRVCREVEEVVPDAVVSVFALDAKGKIFPMAAPSLPEACHDALLRRNRGAVTPPSQRAADSGERVVVLDLERDPSMPMLAPFIDAGIRSCWSSPIVGSNGTVIGVVSFHYTSRRGPDRFQEKVCDVVAEVASLAMEHAWVQDECWRMANCDSITGMPNRTPSWS